MPIEIKELHIKINVDDHPADGDPKKMKKAEREKIVRECVEQVMEIISKKQER